MKKYLSNVILCKLSIIHRNAINLQNCHESSKELRFFAFHDLFRKVYIYHFYVHGDLFDSAPGTGLVLGLMGSLKAS